MSAADVVFLAFVTMQKEVDALAAVVAKKSVPEAGFEPVRMVAIDDDWTGKRFRRVACIKQLPRNPGALVSKEGRMRAGRHSG